MRAKRWTSDCGEKWFELREDGTVHSFTGTELKIYAGKGTPFSIFYLVVGGVKTKFYIAIKKNVAENFVDNPHGYKYFKFIDGDENNFHYSNLRPVRTLFESLTTEGQFNVLEGKRVSMARRREENARLKAWDKDVKTIKEIIETAVATKKGMPSSSVALRRARTREKYFGYEPKFGLFGKKIPREEPKYDSNFKLIK